MPFPLQMEMLRDPCKRKIGKAGRRGGKTVEERAEMILTCNDQAGRCGWGAPNFPVLRDAWREIKSEFAGFIREVRESEWTLLFKSGGMLECWSFDSGIIARGRKYHKFIIDEAGLIPNLGVRFNGEIEPTLGDYDGTLVACSTPNAVSPDFSRWFELGQTPGSGWKSWHWTSLDNPYVASNMAKLIESARGRGVPEWMIQQEYFAEESEDETGFFTRSVIERCKTLHGREPIVCGSIDCSVADVFEREAVVVNKRVAAIQFREDPRGPWKFWQWWDGDRPPQDEIGGAYATGIDLSWGGGASNSVFSVVNADTREKIAEFASPNVTPEEAALLVSMAMLWLGGRPGARIPVVNFEVNGPGEQFAKAMLTLRYGNLRREKAAPSAVDSDDPGRIGWRSGAIAKRILLDEYRAALASGRFQNPSVMALDECLTYHQDGKGRILSEREWMGEDTGETARAPHGDRVIADALAWVACSSVGRARPPEQRAIPGTVAHLLAKERAKTARQSGW